MRHLGLVFVLLSLSSLQLFAFQRLVPGDRLWSYEEAHDGFMGWVIDQLEAAGFDAPKQGEEFAWSKYLSPVDTTDVPQKWDIVKFLDEKGEGHGALVLDMGKNGPVVKKPIGDGLVILMAIDNSQVVGYLRPHKANSRDAPHI